MAKPQDDGKHGEHLVKALLSVNGRRVKNAGYYAPFDLLVDGRVRVEIKTCEGILIQNNPNKPAYRAWMFNLHRHGKLSENTDCYILRISGIPETNTPVHLLVMAPFGKPTISISLRSLIEGDWTQNFKDFDVFKKTGKLPNGDKA
jgi:hypothetical protein